jgi:hypothetical protein
VQFATYTVAGETVTSTFSGNQDHGHSNCSTMAMLDLVFSGKVYSVPEKLIIQFLEHELLFEAKPYAVQSSPSVDVFERFVESLVTQAKISVTIRH